MIMYFSFYISLLFLAMPRPLVKVVAALSRAFTFLTGHKPVACYELLCPAGESRPQDCHASLYIKNQCACYCRVGLYGLSDLPAKVIHLI